MVGYILRHINPFRLFNDKSRLYIYIKYMFFKQIVYIAQSAGAVEYTGCRRVTINECPEYDTK